MFKLTGDARYIDLLEQSLYNAVLAGVSLEGDTFCYATPLACDSKFERQPWFDVPCCPTTAARFFPSIGRYIYSRSSDGVWVNLYVGGQGRIGLENGPDVTVRQSTNYPWAGHIKLELAVPMPSEFTLHLRLPGWASGPKIAVNGREINPPISKGYAHLYREWTTGTVVELTLHMAVEKLEANPQVLQSRGELCLRRGPLIYCFERPDNPIDLERIALPVDAKLTEHFEPGLLGGVVVLAGDGRMQPPVDWTDQLYRPIRSAEREAVALKAIPYYVWGNRGRQQMKVWIDSVAS